MAGATVLVLVLNESEICWRAGGDAAIFPRTLLALLVNCVTFLHKYSSRPKYTVALDDAPVSYLADEFPLLKVGPARATQRRVTFVPSNSKRTSIYLV